MIVEILLCLVIGYITWQIVKKPTNYPPGPWGLPLVGYIPYRTKNFTKKLTELRKQHGDILSWRIGTRLMVFLCNFKVTKESFLGQNFVDRPDLSIFTALEGENQLGVITTNGMHWHSLRRFCLRHLRDLGMGKSKLVDSIHFEALELIKSFKKQAGKSAPIPYDLTVAALNVVWLVVADKRYDLQSKEIKEFDDMIRDIQYSFSRMAIHDFFPWIQHFLPKSMYKSLIKKENQIKISNKMRKFLGKIIEEHQQLLDKSNPRDLIDAYLIEMETKKEDPDSTMSIEDLTYLISDFFGAGSETTKTTIHWAIYYMASFPNVQKRLQKEIDQVIPKGNLVSLEDKPKLPYLEAFIHETLRYSTLIPNGLPHAATQDTSIGGYFIPKGTIVTPIVKFIHFDPNNFESPYEFRPERFLSPEGKFVNPKEGFMPFIIGRRQCLGEAFARMELFIFLSTLIHNLNFSIPPGKKINLEPLENPLMALPSFHQDVFMSIR